MQTVYFSLDSRPENPETASSLVRSTRLEGYNSSALVQSWSALVCGKVTHRESLQLFGRDEIARLYTCERLVRHVKTLGERAIYGLCGVDDHLASPDIMDERRIERVALYVTYDVYVIIRLNARGHCPHDLFLFERVHVSVNDDNVLDKIAVCHRHEGCLFGLSLHLLVNGYITVEPAGAGD